MAISPRWCAALAGAAVLATGATAATLGLLDDATAPLSPGPADATAPLTEALAGDPAPASSDGLTLLSRTRISPRVVELKFSTSALTLRPRIRVVLPDSYVEGERQRYPVLYLLHGAQYTCTEGGAAQDCGADWLGEGEAEALTAGLPLIVVVIDSATDGFYTDWWNFGQGGPPWWATFHIDQLLPWIDRNFPTTPVRGQRAIAGLSMGGGGTMSYAGRFPDRFVAAASFSGALDLTHPVIRAAYEAPTSGTAQTQWGPFETEEVRWRGDNSTDLAVNLGNTDIAVFTGNGLPGGPNGNLVDPVEMTSDQTGTAFHNRLDELGIPHLFSAYGPGDHTFYYWKRDLREWLPRLMAIFAEHRAPPTAFSYISVRPGYSLYGWTVAMQRPAMEFSALKVASAGAFEITGSGTAAMTTPPAFNPRRSYQVTISAGSGTTTQRVTADGAGSLALGIPLGPGNPYQQYSPLARSLGVAGVTVPLGPQPLPFQLGEGSRFYRATVTITRP